MSLWIEERVQRAIHTTSKDRKKMRRSSIEKGTAVVVLTILSKAFDQILHKLLFAKFKAYRFDYSNLKLLILYLNQRIQRTKTNCFLNNFEIVGLSRVCPNLGIHDLFLLDF